MTNFVTKSENKNQTNLFEVLLKLFEFRMSTKPQGNSALLKSMLFNEKYSDLIFEWDDGSRVNAHQMVVFGRSEYFELVNPKKYFSFLNHIQNIRIMGKTAK